MHGTMSLKFFKVLYMFQTAFPSIIRSPKLHIQRHVFVRLLLLPDWRQVAVTVWQIRDAVCAVQFWAPDDGRKTRLKHVECLTEINKLWNVASCWLYSANILAMHGSMNFNFVFPCIIEKVKWNTNLMKNCAGFISAESLYMFRAQAPIIMSI